MAQKRDPYNAKTAGRLFFEITQGERGERLPQHTSLRNGVRRILGNATILDMQDEVPDYSFKISCMSDASPAKINLFTQGTKFEAEIPPYKPATVICNGFDISDNVGMLNDLVGHLRNIYRYLYSD